MLAGLLRPGMSVLDVGCGTGSITADIADAVYPGKVVGIDRDASLIATARTRTEGRPNLTFDVADALAFNLATEFDIATAARTLQWIADPGRAVRRMAAAIRPGGTVVLLDYDHSALVWEPHPPTAVTAFYTAFLHWRESLGFDNRIAARLSGLLAGAGLVDITTSNEHEAVARGDPGFAPALAIWQSVIADVGPNLVAADLLRQKQLDEASAAYRHWADTRALSQRMVLRAAVGTKPA
jgi:SAM-dependent methyltransferase